jgi:hypothetical protein
MNMPLTPRRGGIKISIPENVVKKLKADHNEKIKENH